MAEERTAEQMRDALTQPPDLDAWDEWDRENLASWKPHDEDTVRAYVDEHQQICAWCGQTRDWHNFNPVNDHSFDPTEKVATLR